MHISLKVGKYLPALLNRSTCIRKSHFSLLAQTEVHRGYGMVGRIVIRLKSYNKAIDYFFKAPLQVIFAREGRVANREGSLIGTFLLFNHRSLSTLKDLR